MDSFRSLLNLNDLSSMYSAVSSIQEYYFTTTFFKGAKDVDSDTVELIKINATNRPGPSNTRGANARRIQPKGAEGLRATLFHYFVEMDLAADALRALREPESFALQDKGRQVLQIQVDEMATRHRLHKEAVFRCILVYGRVNFDVAGEILEPSVHATTGALTDASGTVVSADFGVANAHRGNLGGTIGALWSTGSTQIGLHLDTLRRKAAIAGTARPTTVIINGIKKTLLRANTEFNDWAKYNSVRVDQVLTGDGIDGLWGFNWKFLDGTYELEDGTAIDLIPLTGALILPDIGGGLSWLRNFNGSELLPTDLELKTSVDAAVASLVTIYGQYAFSQLQFPPTRLSMFYGDNFGMNFADPNAIWSPTVFA